MKQITLFIVFIGSIVYSPAPVCGQDINYGALIPREGKYPRFFPSKEGDTMVVATYSIIRRMAKDILQGDRYRELYEGYMKLESNAQQRNEKLETKNSLLSESQANLAILLDQYSGEYQDKVDRYALYANGALESTNNTVKDIDLKLENIDTYIREESDKVSVWWKRVAIGMAAGAGTYMILK